MFGRRGFSLQEPRVTLVIVLLLAVAAFGLLRMYGRQARLRTALERDLGLLSLAQTDHHRRFGFYARRFGPAESDNTVLLVPGTGNVITIERADSAAWSASGTHPALRHHLTCAIRGGATTLGAAGKVNCQ